MGSMTATFGGLIRDVVCTETPLILKREVYATAAAAGATALVAGQGAGPAGAAGGRRPGVAIAFAIRGRGARLRPVPARLPSPAGPAALTPGSLGR